ncbi:hypothetical protein HD_0180 [[Haemophilus] ducreyi 35000HP]|uniref:Uncharacterized protein n=1 Tax=Haemophilus ducreyi (strain 35000HP / ATCC 700724) TaxID=233412 RepID=Q7VPA9_HAEDU|nr:hypothetical protein HD_0180 [[Haemophilus] ducreyi 35000HP]
MLADLKGCTISNIISLDSTGFFVIFKGLKT